MARCTTTGSARREDHGFHAGEFDNQGGNNFSDEFYIIEALLDKRLDPYGREEYLVRWQDYPPECDTWEPRAELERNAIHMLKAFNNQEEYSSMGEMLELHCVCQIPYKAGDGAMIQCFTCSEWFHFQCIGMDLADANSYTEWHCYPCRISQNLRNRKRDDNLEQDSQETETDGEYMATVDDFFAGMSQLSQHANVGSQEHMRCICRKPYRPGDGTMVQCYSCSRRCHFACVQQVDRDARSFTKWHCDRCRTGSNPKAGRYHRSSQIGIVPNEMELSRSQTQS